MKNNNNEKKSILSNLSERDKKLLSLVGGVVVIAGCAFLVANSYTKNSQLAEEYNTIKTELDGKTAKINQKKSLTKQLVNLNSQALKQAQKYYGTTNQGEFIYLIDSLVKQSGIKFNSVNYSETTALEFPEGTASDVTASNQGSGNTSANNTSSSSSSGDTSNSSSTSSSNSGDTSASSSESSSSQASSSDSSTSAASAADSEQVYANTNITQMTADIEFKGTYTQILRLLELIDNNQKKIVSSELELGDSQSQSDVEEQTDPVVNGTIKLRFYQVKDVERYVTKVESMVDKTPIKFAHLESPFMIPSWLASSSSDSSSGTDSTGSSNGLGAATGTDSSTNLSSSSSDSSGTSLTPSYLEQLNNLSNQNNGLSAYYNSSTIYRFEDPLKLVQTGNKSATDVTVDKTDFLEGTGSNVVKIPATKSTTLFEMTFAEPYVTLNDKPDGISFSLSLSSQWQGKIGLIVRNSNGQKIYLHIIRPNNWTGWREISFNPANIPGFSYPMTILGYYFETPTSDSPETTMKLDNLTVDHLVTN